MTEVTVGIVMTVVIVVVGSEDNGEGVIEETVGG